jgi:leucyl-tRNA synthetase
MWEDSGVAGTRRFLDKAWRLVTETPTDDAFEDRAVERALHRAIGKVDDAVRTMRFNTAVSEMMIFVNEAQRAGKVRTEWKDLFVRILSPFAPHLAEEMWEALGHRGTIAFAPWPQADPAKLAVDTIAIAVQVNGKLRGQAAVAPDADKDAVLAAARENVAKHLEGVTVRREVYVPGRLVNFVVG